MCPVRSRLRLLLGGAAVLSGLMVSGAPALGQSQSGAVPVVSQPVVQSISGGEGMKLNDALGRLAADPRDVAALLDAGHASLDLGDIDAAIGFYQRASALAPASSRAKAGLAGAFVLKGDAFTAIPLFREAEQAGPIDPARMADRGLAFDMVGDNLTAQQYYRYSLSEAPSDETMRRMALSQAIAGDRRGMEMTLAPLLQRQDKIAWRTRAFALAILGHSDEAEAIARQSLPADRASAMSAYLRYMPRLTPAQQAAAGNIGHFPRAAEIGIDDPRVVRYAKPRSAQLALGPASQADKGRPGVRGKAPANAALSAPVVPAPAASGQAIVASKPATPAVVAPVDPDVGKDVTRIEVAAASSPTGELAPVAVTPAPQAAIAPAPAPAKSQSLEDVFADFSPPSREAEPQAGAVDLRQLPAGVVAKATVVKGAAAKSDPAADVPAKDAKDAKGKAAKDAKAALAALDCEPATTKGKAAGKDKADAKGKGKAGAKGKGKDAGKAGVSATKSGATQCKDAKSAKQPAHPSRIWVQVAAGKNKKAMAFDWRRWLKEEPATFKGRTGYTSAWGATNRLLTGPFETEAAANAYIAKLKKAGVGDAFIWTSPAGQVVDTLP